VGLKSLKSLNLTNGYPNKNNKNNKNNNNKVKSKPLELFELAGKNHIYYESHQYRNKSKSQLTSPTPPQLPAVAVSTKHILVSIYMLF
jgi:hypothetical protein